MLILVMGQSASGKSAFAEDLVVSSQAEKRYYIATMQPFDEECRQKIARHHQMRAQKGFETVECYFDLTAPSLTPDAVVLVECLSNLLANCLYDAHFHCDDAVAWIVNGVAHLAQNCRDLIVVSNDVFTDGQRYDAAMTDYLLKLAQINRQLAVMADEVIEVVYSLPIVHKKGVV